MKKLTALLLALLMVFTVAALSACKEKGGESSKTADESSKTEQTASPKQLFIDSLRELSAESTKLPTTGKTDFSGMQVSFKANGSVKNGISAIDLGANLNGAFDMKNESFSLDGKLNLLGDTLDVYVGTDGENTYFDLPGILEKAVRLDTSAGTDEDDDTDDGDNYSGGSVTSAGMSTLPLDILNNFPTAQFKAVADLAKESFEKHLKDEYFTESNKDITVNGKEYKNARVLTLSADNDKCVSLLTALRDEVLLSEEMYNAMKALADLTGKFEPGTYEEFVADTKEGTDESFKNLSAGLDAEIVIENGKAAAGSIDAHISFKTEEDAVNITVDAEFDTESHNAVISLDNGADNTMKLTANDTSFEFYIDMAGKRIGEIKCTRNADNVWEGELSLTPNSTDGDTAASAVAVKFAFKADENSFGFNISEISVTNEGVTITLPVQLTVSFEVSEAGITGDISFKLDLTEAGMPLSADLSAEFSVEFKDEVNVSLPESFIKSDEVDPAELLDKLTKKCPNIVAMIKSLLGGTEK